MNESIRGEHLDVTPQNVGRRAIKLATEGVKISEPPLGYDGPKAIDVLRRDIIAGEVVIVSAAPLPE